MRTRTLLLALAVAAGCASEPAPTTKSVSAPEKKPAPASAGQGASAPAPAPSEAPPAPAAAAAGTDSAAEWRALEQRLETSEKTITDEAQARAYFQHAEAELRGFLARFPSAPESRPARLGLAEIQLALDEPGAVEALEKIADENATDDAGLEALDMLVHERLGKGDLVGAKKSLERLAQAMPSHPGLEMLRAAIAAEEKKPQVGQPAPAIAGKTLDGAELALASLRGKVVLVDFWATWCGPCRAELPNVLRAYEKFHPRGLEIVGVSLDQDEQKLRAFLEEKKMAWPQFYDGKGWENEIAVAWGIDSIPATYLIDQDGVVRAKGARGEALDRAVEALLPGGGR